MPLDYRTFGGNRACNHIHLPPPSRRPSQLQEHNWVAAPEKTDPPSSIFILHATTTFTESIANIMIEGIHAACSNIGICLLIGARRKPGRGVAAFFCPTADIMPNGIDACLSDVWVTLKIPSRIEETGTPDDISLSCRGPRERRET